MLTLNIAGGKLSPMPTALEGEGMMPSYVLNVDTSYYAETTPMAVEQDAINWAKDPDRTDKQAFINTDIFEFMERTILQFDRVVIYRFLEHVSFTQVDYFIYLVSTITHEESMVDVLVPNYQILAKRIIDEEKRMKQHDFGKYDDFDGWNIELTTELLNEPSCPHASIWTPYRAKKLWEKEKRFSVDPRQINERCHFDGRDIYMRFFAWRV